MLKKLAVIGSLVFLLAMAITTPWHGATNQANAADGISLFEHNLFFGMRGNADVSNLQEFLTDQGYYAGPVSGNFYLLTLQGVRKFQSANGITATGFFGSKSRTVGNEILSKIIGQICAGDTCDDDTLPNPQLAITSDSDLHAQVGQYFVANFKVTGGNGTYSITPQGEVQGLSWTGTYCPPVGVGGSARMCAQVVSNDSVTLFGTPARAGVYTITIVARENNIKPVDQTIPKYGKATFTVVVTDGSVSGKAPVISGVKGPSTLNVGEEGIWSITASDPLNGSLSYRVVWGDERIYAGNEASMSAPQVSFKQTATFSHRYDFAGTYNPTFYVVNDAGLEAKVSLSVTIGKGEPVPSVTVLSPNGKEVWSQGETHTITWNSNYLNAKSYNNMARISLLHPVQCFRAPCNDEEIFVADGVFNSGSYSWTIPDTLTSGSYRVKVSLLSAFRDCPPPPICESGQICIMPACPDIIGSPVATDTSDDYFTIRQSSVAKGVTITGMAPASGRVGAMVTLTGKGFAGTNTVHFSSGVILNVPSDGATLTFTVPDSLNLECYYSTPACLAPSMLVVPGTYSVWVTNANGTSNQISFTVTGTTN